MDVQDYKPFTIHLDADFGATGENGLPGVWYVADDRLTMRWANGAVDTIVVGEGTMAGQGKTGVKLKLFRSK